MPRLSQPFFGGGEITPALYARTDIETYGRALKTAYNVILIKQGGFSGRAGTEHICEVSDSSYAHRLTPFKFNTLQNYVNVWGNLKMRIIKDSQEVLDDSQNIVSISQASPGSIEITGHGLSLNAKVYVSGVGGMTPLNARYYLVNSVPDADHITLKDLFGTPINTSAMPAFTSGGVVARVTTVVTPYTSNADPNNTAAQVFFMDYAQVNDVAFVAHINVAPQELTRTDHNDWTIGGQSIGATLAAPGSIAATATTGSGATTYNYTVTAINDATGEESVAGTADNCTNDLSADPSYKNTITWAAVTDATRYSIYKEEAGQFGYIGSVMAPATSFVDGVPNEYTPDLAFTPPTNFNPFGGAGDYPACVEFHQARLCYGQTDNNPGFYWLSQPTRFSNFNYARPQRADDLVTGRLLPGVNAIQGMCSIGGALALFTSEAEFTLTATEISGAITPVSQRADRWSAHGSDRLQPIMVDKYALFVDRMGQGIFAFGSDANQRGRFESQELSLLAPHLFEGHFIVDWCYQQKPYSVIWIVRDDGMLITLTVMPDQQIFGFGRVALAGTSAGAAVVESCCTIPGATEDEVYFEVKRTIDGVTKRYVERLASLYWGDDPADFWGLDSALLYDGVATSTITGLHHLEGEDVAALADGWLITEGLTVTDGEIELPTDTLPSGASKVLVGLLPDDPEVEPLPVAQPTQSGAVQGKRKNVTGVVMKLLKTVAIDAGSNADNLFPAKIRPAQTVGPTPPYTGDVMVKFTPKYAKDGTFLMRGTAGLPFTVLAIYPDVQIEDAHVKLEDA